MKTVSPDTTTPQRRGSTRRGQRRAESLVLPLDRILIAAAAVGVIVSLYLAAVDLSGGSTLCVQGSDCDAVRGSEYGRLLGVPLAALGVAYFGAILGLALARRPQLTPALQVAGGLGLGASLLFLGIQGIALGAWCPYCLIADAAAILVSVRTLLPVSVPTRAAIPGAALLRGSSGAALSVAVLLAGYAFAPDPAAPAPVNEMTLLADHLKQSGAMFYGAYWCPHCQNQKKMFGSAAGNLPYVECDARGSGARPDLCQAAGVKAFPTWVINGERREGEVSITDLKRLSKFGS